MYLKSKAWALGMAKSGDDLMRWQSIARGGRRCCRPKNIPCRSIEMESFFFGGGEVSQRAVKIYEW